MNSELTAEKARQYSKNSLFADKTWRWSPSPWNLPDGICQWIEDLSTAAVSFYRAIDLLYRKSWKMNQFFAMRNYAFHGLQTTMMQVNHLG